MHLRRSPLIVLLASSSVAALALAACGGGSKANGTGGKETTGTGDHTSSSSSGQTTTGTGGTGTTGTTGTGAGGSPPACGTDGWLTYGHDAQRTGASGGCVKGPLTTTWRYVPTPPAMRTFKAVFNAVAQSDAVFVGWSASDDPYLGTTALDRVDTTGARVWTFDSGTDSELGNWLTVTPFAIVLNEDGLYYVDPMTGMKTGGNGVDNWGQTLTDGTSLYAVNDAHIDGPGLYVGAYDDTCKQIWTSNTYGMCRIDAADIANGLALDAGTLFYAANYSAGMGVTLPFASGVFAFDPATGKQTWYQAAAPTSGISAGGGLVYAIEGGATLVARKESDGTMAWSAPVAGAGTQAPVLASGLAIVAGQAGVAAFSAATGAPKWTAAANGAAAQAFQLQFEGGCVPGTAIWSGSNFATAVATTTLVAMPAADAVLVTAQDGIHLLSLSTGTETWMGTPTQIMGAARNPIVVGSTVYVVDDGGLVALGGS
jgi:PQQ-like domain